MENLQEIEEIKRLLDDARPEHPALGLALDNTKKETRFLILALIRGKKGEPLYYAGGENDFWRLRSHFTIGSEIYRAAMRSVDRLVPLEKKLAQVKNSSTIDEMILDEVSHIADGRCIYSKYPAPGGDSVYRAIKEGRFNLMDSGSKELRTALYGLSEASAKLAPGAKLPGPFHPTVYEDRWARTLIPNGFQPPPRQTGPRARQKLTKAPVS